jgi:hypothetical protein
VSPPARYVPPPFERPEFPNDRVDQTGDKRVLSEVPCVELNMDHVADEPCLPRRKVGPGWLSVAALGKDFFLPAFGKGGSGIGGAILLGLLDGPSSVSLTVSGSTLTGNAAVGGAGGSRPPYRPPSREPGRR